MTLGKIHFVKISREEYLTILPDCKNTTFYNCRARFEFLVSQNRPLFFFKITSSNTSIGILHYQIITTKTGKIMYFQHTPLLLIRLKEEDLVQLFSALKEFVKNELKEKNIPFARFTPRIPGNLLLKQKIYKLGYLRAPVQEIDACVTHVINLGSFDMSSIRKTTRHSIKKGIESGINTVFEDNPLHFTEFLDYYNQMKKIKDFTPLPSPYLQKELEIYSQNKMLLQCKTIKGTDILSITEIIIDKDKGYYYHAATSLNGRRTNASHVNLYMVALELKKRGIKSLDLWGGAVPSIAYEKKISHPWKNLDIFKRGFADELQEYLPPLDIPASPLKYAIPFLLQYFRTRKKGYPIIK